MFCQPPAPSPGRTSPCRPAFQDESDRTMQALGPVSCTAVGRRKLGRRQHLATRCCTTSCAMLHNAWAPPPDPQCAAGQAAGRGWWCGACGLAWRVCAYSRYAAPQQGRSVLYSQLECTPRNQGLRVLRGPTDQGYHQLLGSRCLPVPSATTLGALLAALHRYQTVCSFAWIHLKSLSGLLDRGTRSERADQLRCCRCMRQPHAAPHNCSSCMHSRFPLFPGAPATSSTP